MFAADEEIGRDLAPVDWAATPLGPHAFWPQSLQPAVVPFPDVDGLGAAADVLLQRRPIEVAAAGSVTETPLKVSGLDQTATVVTRD